MAASMASVVEALTQAAAAQQRIQLAQQAQTQQSGSSNNTSTSSSTNNNNANLPSTTQPSTTTSQPVPATTTTNQTIKMESELPSLTSDNLTNSLVMNLATSMGSSMPTMATNSMVANLQQRATPSPKREPITSISQLTPSDFKRPPHTYPSLIAQAILDSPNNLITLRGIYDYIMEKYPYYKFCHDKSAWQNSIRHNLSLNQCFIKVPRYENAAKSNFWTMTNEGFDEFAGDNAFKRRRRRGKYDCQVLYKQSIKSKLSQENRSAQSPVMPNGILDASSLVHQGSVYDTSSNSPSSAAVAMANALQHHQSSSNSLKRGHGNSHDSLSGILSPLMKIPALGTGQSPQSPSNGSSAPMDQAQFFLLNNILNGSSSTNQNSNSQSMQQHMNQSQSLQSQSNHSQANVADQHQSQTLSALLSSPVYQQLFLSGASQSSQQQQQQQQQPSNGPMNSIQNLQAQLLHSLKSQQQSSTTDTLNLFQNSMPESNLSHIQNETVHGRNSSPTPKQPYGSSALTSLAQQHGISNVAITTPSKINTSSSSVSHELSLPSSGIASVSPTAKQEAGVSNPGLLSTIYHLPVDTKLFINDQDAKITASPQTPANHCAIRLQGLKDILLYFLNLSQNELYKLYLANCFSVNMIGAVTADTDKTVLISTIIDHVFTDREHTGKQLQTAISHANRPTMSSAIEATEEVLKVQALLSAKNMEHFAEKFVQEGFTLQTILDMSETDVNDAAIIIGLKGGEKMRLRQLVRQSGTVRKSPVVKEEAATADTNSKSEMLAALLSAAESPKALEIAETGETSPLVKQEAVEKENTPPSPYAMPRLEKSPHSTHGSEPQE